MPSFSDHEDPYDPTALLFARRDKRTTKTAEEPNPLGHPWSCRCDDCNLRETACNIAEDMDSGHIFRWRVEQVLEHLKSGGTTAIDAKGELVLVAQS